MKTEEIIKALRCSASAHQEDEDRETCPYCRSEDLPLLELAQVFGQNCLCSCDTDKIAMDAADRLDELQERCIRYAEEAMEQKARLARYEDAELDGRLVVLPCKVGDTVWMVVTKRPKLTMPEFSFVKRSCLTWLNMERILRDFGKTVFLTREEAEAELTVKGGETDAE